MTALEKFQAFLQDLFQLELADLDFGIYRLLHLRYREIESFLTDQLPRRAVEAFDRTTGDTPGVRA
ncbi:hypothetical protein [Desulfatirhabdium butyrativorans]|uniref:hypothetical protein n=1 Tax=Desulfatirhabdium butyrativorans TaxID=340467 RepID=UPI00041106D3|nr:hypothetical protein [Desulfatirhabdium butyrativorans]